MKPPLQHSCVMVGLQRLAPRAGGCGAAPSSKVQGSLRLSCPASGELPWQGSSQRLSCCLAQTRVPSSCLELNCIMTAAASTKRMCDQPSVWKAVAVAAAMASSMVVPGLRNLHHRSYVSLLACRCIAFHPEMTITAMQPTLLVPQVRLWIKSRWWARKPSKLQLD